MTAQAPDEIIVRREVRELCDTPLLDYLRRLPKARRPVFVATDSGCWRGYVARWAIRDGWLWLEGLEGWMARDGCDPRRDRAAAIRTVTLTEALPWLRPPVRATWVTRELRSPEGRTVHGVHAGFGSTFERDRFFYAYRGSVEIERLVVNPPPPVEYRVDPATGALSTPFDGLALSPTPRPPEGVALDAPSHWRAAADAFEAEEAARLARAARADRLRRALGRHPTWGELCDFDG
jgi:hypothetical protein